MVEDALAGIVASVAEFVAAGAALSPFSGPPDPGSSARAAGGAAGVADDPIVAPEVQEGTAEIAAPAAPVAADGSVGEGGAAPTPTTGDRPAPKSGHTPPATVVRGEVRERHEGNVTTFEYADQFVVDVPRDPPSPQEEPPPEDADPATTAPPPLPPASAPPPAWQPTFTTESGGWTPPLAPDVGGGESAPPPAPPDPSATPDTEPGGFPVAADVAALMEERSKTDIAPVIALSTTPFGSFVIGGYLLRLVTGMSTEELSDWARKRVADGVTWAVHAAPVGASDAPSRTAAAATVVATVAEGTIGSYAQTADPLMAARGLMRLGAGSAVAMRQIEAGDTARGGAVIAGEVGTALLVVLPAVRAVASTGAPAGTPGVTVYANRFPPVPKSLGELAGHNVVSVTTAGGKTMTTHVVAATAETMGKMNPPRPFPTEFPPGTAAALPLEYGGNVGGYAGYTRAVSAAEALKAYQTMFDAVRGFRYGQIGGPLGPYKLIEESCSTYAARVATDAGIAISGRLGPLMTHFQFKYLGTIEGAQVLMGLTLPGMLQPAVTQGANPAPAQSRP